VKPLIASVLPFLLSIHTFLYQPKLPELPTYRPIATSLPTELTLPIKRLNATESPLLTAQSYLLIDQQSGEVLAAKNPDTQLFPASTTKMMTAILTLETRQLDEVVTVPDDLVLEGSVMMLVPGEHITVRSLLAGLLVHSSNDAAVVLAQTSSGGTNGFVREMNEKAKSLHMNNTHYENPSGLYVPNHVTTVRDLLILGRYSMQNPVFSMLVKQPKAQVKSIDGKIVHSFESTNELLGKFEGIEGIKTGWTEEAGECFVAQATRGGHTLLSAVLRSTDRFGESKTLLTWGFESWRYDTKPLLDWTSYSD
jgi:serine-type D-Ala-D-Ala carboxypeptidase (penicillin-binding protein 5/6)